MPREAAAALAALSFQDRALVPDLTLWEFYDRERLTLLLRPPDGAAAPLLRARESKNIERVARLRSTFAEISTALAERGIEFAVLKGFSLWPDFVPELRRRLQYDLDFFCPESVGAAHDALRQLGYEPMRQSEDLPTDHLTPLARPSAWRWSGDYFDLGIPIAVELHFRLWDEPTEGFAAPGLDAFWPRRIQREWDGLSYFGLALPDQLAQVALHMLRHLLRGDVQISQVYEIAWFLHHRAADDAFWDNWRVLHPAGLRRLEAIAFRLAEQWFGCVLARAALEEVDVLPPVLHYWFARHAAAPVESFFHPNKSELLLHMALLDSGRSRRAVLRRRLFPARLPAPGDAAFDSGKSLSTGLRLHRAWRRAVFAAERASRHLRTLLPALWQLSVEHWLGGSRRAPRSG
ncbi:MAG TPA: nucleotidyltransferase family protein [Bryobacteraceae bacterium]|nr:nucleotidyltransferase family protein [Bryobacteraceae bacterium]